MTKDVKAFILPSSKQNLLLKYLYYLKSRKRNKVQVIRLRPVRNYPDENNKP